MVSRPSYFRTEPEEINSPVLLAAPVATWGTSPRGRTDTYETGTGETFELPLCGTVRKAA